LSFADDLMWEANLVRSIAIKVVVTYGETHPEYARTGIEGYFDHVPELFKPFSEMPEPAGYDTLIRSLEAAMGKLSNGDMSDDPVNKAHGGPIFANPVLSKLGGMESYIEDWTGDAAMAFKENIIDPFDPICRNQFLIAAVLRSAAQAHQAVWKNARDDIMKIAKDTQNALEEAQDCGKNEWTVTFTVVASVAAVGAGALLALPTGGASIAGAGMAITAIGAASQVAATLPPNEQDSYSGESAFRVVQQMAEAIQKLREKIADQERLIATTLSAINDKLYGEPRLFVAHRPALADATPANIAGPGYMGYAK
jgi:hypothetical protein